MSNEVETERVEAAFLLKALCLFVSEDVLSRNSAGFIKILMLRGDARLDFVTRRFMEERITRSAFLTQLLELIERESKLVFDAVFQNCTLHSAKLASREERDANYKNSMVGTSLTYGEIDFRSFCTILQRFTSTRGKIFYDLGSGTGRALVEARLLCDFDQCVGIELLHSLHMKAEKVVRDFDSPKYRNILSVSLPLRDVQVFEGSILEEDWSDGDLIFANSTCFSPDLMARMGVAGEKLRPGAYFITFTKGLTSKAFELMEQMRLKMSWGPATVYIHRRLNNDGSSAEGLIAFDRRKELEAKVPTSPPATGASTAPDKVEENCDNLLRLSDLAPSIIVPGTHAGCVYELKKPSKKVKSLKFLLYCHKPITVDTYRDLPLVLYLHGASSRGETFDQHLGIGLPKHINEVQSPHAENFILLSPLCPPGTEWKEPGMCDALNELTDAVAAFYECDRSRFYLTGVSMGGLGAWMMVARNPGKWAACMPMCGGGNPVYSRLAKDTPFWFFHSEDDNVIGVEESSKLVDALRAEEGCREVKYTRYKESKEHSAAQEWMVGHNVWTKAYGDKETWDWLFSQRLSVMYSTGKKVM